MGTASNVGRPDVGQVLRKFSELTACFDDTLSAVGHLHLLIIVDVTTMSGRMAEMTFVEEEAVTFGTKNTLLVLEAFKYTMIEVLDIHVILIFHFDWFSKELSLTTLT